MRDSRFPKQHWWEGTCKLMRDTLDSTLIQLWQVAFDSTSDGTQTATQTTLMHRSIWKHTCFASTWVTTGGTQTATQTTLMHRSIWKRICFACIWVITEGIQTATQTTLTHRSIWKHICFSHYIRFYRGNSNRNSNPTQTHLIVKRTHFAVFELSETWDFIIFKRTSLKHPQSSKGRKKPCVSEF